MGLVIGEIAYTNIMPFFYYLDRVKLQQLGCSFIHKVPASLNQGMQKGVIDVGGISSFAYAQNATKYTLLPNLSVSAKNAVGSIFLFSKKPIEALNGASVALTNTSATSVNLLKILFHHFYRYEVTYETMEPSFETMMAHHDACLLIGDDAIVNGWKNKDKYYQYDLGELWKKFTGLSMTFAVFAVRNEVLEKEKEALQYLYQQFVESKKRCIENHFEEMIFDIQKRLGGSFSFWQQYFHGLNFALGDYELKGLKHYYNLAYEYGLLEYQVKTIALWDDVPMTHSIE